MCPLPLHSCSSVIFIDVVNTSLHHPISVLVAIKMQLQYFKTIYYPTKSYCDMPKDIR